ncbi:hypothetical protein GCM10009102_22490 [Sphingomonas insulae]|uniref:Uncharacterized protein n=1 Tax=Sphingomonas insulae TaxID=424800 RepID=A0ABN1HWM7_9SPHN
MRDRRKGRPPQGMPPFLRYRGSDVPPASTAPRADSPFGTTNLPEALPAAPVACLIRIGTPFHHLRGTFGGAAGIAG